tara:strand:+ start:579 stop:1148 length:570 start_codon:yes stop_codon:yes gene_type:complete
MRIISGSFRGKKLFEPKDNFTRPLKDLTKESIFNILQHSNKFSIKIENANILDLFSGVGSFGIECLSRGVKFVIFIENYIKVLPALKKNLDNLKSVKNYLILKKDIYNKNTLLTLNKKFDIIFLDPPYKDKNLITIFEMIDEGNILNETGLIILHRHKNEKDIFPSKFRIIENKTYGISKIIFLSFSNK